jgi:hypothetical protein
MVWQEIKTQVVTAGMGVAGINYQEMRQAIRDLGLYRSRGLEQKIKALERSYVSHVNASGQSDDKQSAGQRIGGRVKGGKTNRQVVKGKKNRS